jgi:hypothetical protein
MSSALVPEYERGEQNRDLLISEHQKGLILRECLVTYVLPNTDKWWGAAGMAKQALVFAGEPSLGNALKKPEQSSAEGLLRDICQNLYRSEQI